MTQNGAAENDKSTPETDTDARKSGEVQEISLSDIQVIVENTDTGVSGATQTIDSAPPTSKIKSTPPPLHVTVPRPQSSIPAPIKPAPAPDNISEETRESLTGVDKMLNEIPPSGPFAPKTSPKSTASGAKKEAETARKRPVTIPPPPMVPSDLPPVASPTETAKHDAPMENAVALIADSPHLGIQHHESSHPESAHPESVYPEEDLDALFRETREYCIGLYPSMSNHDIKEIHQVLEKIKARKDAGPSLRIIMDPDTRSIISSSVKDFRVFTEAVEKKGYKAGEALQRAEMIYQRDKQLYQLIAEIAKIKGHANCDALCMGWQVYGQDSQALSVFYNVASKYTPQHIKMLTKVAIALFPKGTPINNDMLKRVANLIMEEGFECGETIIEAKKMSDVILMHVIELIEKRGKQRADALLRAAKILGKESEEQLKIFKETLIVADETTADAMLSIRDIYGKEVTRLPKIAEVAIKFGANACKAISNQKPVWTMAPGYFDIFCRTMLEHDEGTISSLAEAQPQLVKFNAAILAKLEKEMSAESGWETSPTPAIQRTPATAEKSATASTRPNGK